MPISSFPTAPIAGGIAPPGGVNFEVPVPNYSDIVKAIASGIGAAAAALGKGLVDLFDPDKNRDKDKSNKLPPLGTGTQPASELQPADPGDPLAYFGGGDANVNWYACWQPARILGDQFVEWLAPRWQSVGQHEFFVETVTAAGQDVNAYDH